MDLVEQVAKAMCWCGCPVGECHGEANNNVPSCYDQARAAIRAVEAYHAKTPPRGKVCDADSDTNRTTP